MVTDTSGPLSWRQRGIIGFAALSRIMTGALIGTVLAVYIGRRGSPLAVSMIHSANFVGMMLFAPVWGAIADITGRRRGILVVSGVLATAAILPLTLMEGTWIPIVLRGLYAACAAGFVPVMLSISSTHGGAEDRGREIGFFNTAYAIGAMGGKLGAGVLLGLLLPEGIFWVVAAISLVSTVVVVFLADPAPRPETDPTVSELLAEIRSRLLPAVGDRGHLRTNGLQWLYVALALRNMTVLGVGSMLAPYLLDSVGVSAFLMGAILAFNPASQAMCMYVFGKVADLAGRKPLIVVGMAGSGLHALLAAVAVLPETVALRGIVAGFAMIVIGAAYASMTTGALAFIGDVSPPAREGELMGLRSTAKGIGGVIGPILLGTIATVTSYAVAFATGSLLALLAALLAAVALTESKSAELDIWLPLNE